MPEKPLPIVTLDMMSAPLDTCKGKPFAAPAADVLLLAHSGFTNDGRARPWWRVPTHRQFLVRGTLVPAVDVPRTEADLAGWLDRRWAEIDSWVADVSTAATG